MKIWITGAGGLVGKTMQHLCKEQNISFVATGHAEVDISSPTQVHHFFDLHADTTHIVNCAAYTNVDEAEKEEEKAFKTNSLGPENLGKLASLSSIRLLHLSTDYVFNTKGPALLGENAPCTPCNIYAKTKHEGEARLQEQFPRGCIIRTSWVFGKGGKNFVSFLWEKLHKENAVTAVVDQYNRLTYAQDLARAIFALLDYEGIFHFANQGATSRYEVANYMKELLQRKGQPLACRKIVPASKRDFLTLAVRPQFSALDTQKIEAVLGKAPRSWKEALEEYIDAEI